MGRDYATFYHRHHGLLWELYNPRSAPCTNSYATLNLHHGPWQGVMQLSISSLPWTKVRCYGILNHHGLWWVLQTSITTIVYGELWNLLSPPFTVVRVLQSSVSTMDYGRSYATFYHQHGLWWELRNRLSPPWTTVIFMWPSIITVDYGKSYAASITTMNYGESYATLYQHHGLLWEICNPLSGLCWVVQPSISTMNYCVSYAVLCHHHGVRWEVMQPSIIARHRKGLSALKSLAVKGIKQRHLFLLYQTQHHWRRCGTRNAVKVKPQNFPGAVLHWYLYSTVII